MDEKESSTPNTQRDAHEAHTLVDERHGMQVHKEIKSTHPYTCRDIGYNYRSKRLRMGPCYQREAQHKMGKCSGVGGCEEETTTYTSKLSHRPYTVDMARYEGNMGRKKQQPTLHNARRKTSTTTYKVKSSGSTLL